MDMETFLLAYINISDASKSVPSSDRLAIKVGIRLVRYLSSELMS